VIDLRLGSWTEALSDLDSFDTLISDPPFSERTHSGHDQPVGDRRDKAKAREIRFKHWTASDVIAFVEAFEPRCRGWFCALTDHELSAVFEQCLRDAGRYVFTPIPCVSPGSRVRLQGDGPSCWTTQLVVSRPKRLPFSAWGTLPGAYVIKPERKMLVAGGKQLELMRAIVRDYSRPGDLICDPCAGGATTLIAAAIEGRRSIGSEVDPATFEKAQARIESRIALGWDPAVPPVPAPLHGEQGRLTL